MLMTILSLSLSFLFFFEKIPESFLCSCSIAGGCEKVGTDCWYMGCWGCGAGIAAAAAAAADNDDDDNDDDDDDNDDDDDDGDDDDGDGDAGCAKLRMLGVG